MKSKLWTGLEDEISDLVSNSKRQPLVGRGSDVTYSRRRWREAYAKSVLREKMRSETGTTFGHLAYIAEKIWAEREALVGNAAGMSCLFYPVAPPHHLDEFDIPAPSYSTEAALEIHASNQAIINGQPAAGRLAEVTSRLSDAMRAAYESWKTYRLWQQSTIPNLYFEEWATAILYHGQAGQVEQNQNGK